MHCWFSPIVIQFIQGDLDRYALLIFAYAHQGHVAQTGTITTENKQLELYNCSISLITYKAVG